MTEKQRLHILIDMSFEAKLLGYWRRVRRYPFWLGAAFGPFVWFGLALLLDALPRYWGIGRLFVYVTVPPFLNKMIHLFFFRFLCPRLEKDACRGFGEGGPLFWLETLLIFLGFSLWFGILTWMVTQLVKSVQSWRKG